MNSTPLQLAIMTARIANGGYEVQPNLLLASATPREELAPPKPRDKPTAPSLRFNPQHMALIREGMIQVSRRHRQPPAQDAKASWSSRSSSSPARPAPPRSSASPSASASMGITQDQLPWHLRHHALFVCFGPVDNPRYACAVIIEHGKAGGATGGPIGRDVLIEVMKRDPSRRTDGFRKMASR